MKSTPTYGVVGNRLLTLYQRHERWIPIAFFAAGVLFDILFLGRIDDLFSIAQQALYLFISAALIHLEIVDPEALRPPPRGLARFWPYRESALHFFLGGLLSSYTLFFLKSSSAFSSTLFILVLMVLLVVNEFMHFGREQTKVHVAFFSLCLMAYAVAMVPIALGFMGLITFLLAVTLSVAALWAWLRLGRRASVSPERLRTHLAAPFLGVQIIFVALYFLHAIPPIPLSTTYMGIYHGAERQADHYALSYTRPWWKFWQKGDQTFQARPGDRIHAFVQVFAPTRFEERLAVRWLYKDARGNWQTADAIPIALKGGREEGFRAVTQKEYFTPGDWQIRVETSEGREVGRLGFEVLMDPSTETRVYRTELR